MIGRSFMLSRIKLSKLTYVDNSYYGEIKPGTYLGAVHGWFIFIKPLSPSEHTVRYVNDVRSTTLGAGNTNNADITYSFKVK